jgi:sterol 24-C-methyltransferase
VTDFYQFGWSDSFHFGPRKIHETFDESLKRAEYYLSSRLGLKQYISDDNSEGGKRPMRALDLGCGIGGPMRNISTFSQCHIEGITINAYQVKVGNKKNRERGLSHCHLQQGDFQNVGLIWPSAYFDAVYQIEATCHSPNRVQTFLGVASVLKRGGLFGGYEWGK